MLWQCLMLTAEHALSSALSQMVARASLSLA